MTEFDKL